MCNLLWHWTRHHDAPELKKRKSCLQDNSILFRSGLADLARPLTRRVDFALVHQVQVSILEPEPVQHELRLRLDMCSGMGLDMCLDMGLGMRLDMRADVRVDISGSHRLAWPWSILDEATL